MGWGGWQEAGKGDGSWLLIHFSCAMDLFLSQRGFEVDTRWPTIGLMKSTLLAVRLTKKDRSSTATLVGPPTDDGPSKIGFHKPLSIGKQAFMSILSDDRLVRPLFLVATVSQQARELKKANVELIDGELFAFPRLESRLVPHYRVLRSKSDVQLVLNQLKVTKDQLPRMLSRDVIARYLGLQPGDIVYAADAHCWRLVVAQ